jgi:hypothetical protein
MYKRPNKDDGVGRGEEEGKWIVVEVLGKGGQVSWL